MRIDFVITELYVGGAERCLTELAIGLREAGDDVRVFSLGKLPDHPRRGLVDRLESAGVPLVSGQADSIWQLPGTYRRLKSWFAERPPDVCQTFLYHANVLGTFAARSSGVNVCVGGLRVADPSRARSIIERAAIKRMTSVVCVSKAVGQFASDQLKCEQDRIHVIPNGVDMERLSDAQPFAWTDLGWPSDAIVSLFVGRLHPQKGIELLQHQIDCLAPVGSRRRLLLVGDGPLRGQLESWTRTLGDERVQLLPWQADVAPLMKASRLLVLPSHYEGMPNVVLEAMAAGRPVVCSRVHGSEELLAHNPDQSFPAGDERALKKLVELYLSDELLSDQVGSENQSRVRQKFSLSAMVNAYGEHYRTVAPRRRDE